MALLMRNYFVASFDDSKLTLLALFDVSAAFDTVNRVILLDILFDFSGTLLLWLRSFLSERSLCVVHGPSRRLWAPAFMVFHKALCWDLSFT